MLRSWILLNMNTHRPRPRHRPVFTLLMLIEFILVASMTLERLPLSHFDQ